jgi:hypothetical protein
MGSDLVFRWRKSSFSGSTGDCVELGAAWRKSSFSGGNGECVELANTGAVRDSKNPEGPVISADLDALVSSVKAGRLEH